MKTKAKPKRRRYWVRFHWGECPVCGSDSSYRERVYGRKPKDSRLRHVYIPDTSTYDHCVG